MSAGQHIDYDALVRGAIQEAKRSVVRTVLQQVGKSGLVGGHHFLIAFNTQAPGVILSKRLRDKYPLEMTIVLQHRFWDLEVSDDRFEVKLTFDSIPERLAIPFTAIKAFYDPSVPYMMPFDDGDGGQESSRDGLTDGAAPRGERRRDRQPRRPRPADARTDGGDPSAVPTNGPRQDVPQDQTRTEPAPSPVPAAAQPVRLKPVTPATAAPATADDGKKAEAAKPDPDAPAAAPQGGAKVLDLSSFRGKKK